MAPGIPGLGIASVFYVAAALLAPLREVVRTARGDSSAARWKIVRRQFSLAIGILVSLVLLYIGFDALIARGLSPPPVPFSVPGGYPTWVYAIGVLAAVLFSVTMSAAALGWHARTTRSKEASGSIVDAYRATITLIERVPPTADGGACYLAVSPPHEEPRAGEDDIDIQIDVRNGEFHRSVHGPGHDDRCLTNTDRWRPQDARCAAVAARTRGDQRRADLGPGDAVDSDRPAGGSPPDHDQPGGDRQRGPPPLLDQVATDRLRVRLGWLSERASVIRSWLCGSAAHISADLQQAG